MSWISINLASLARSIKVAIIDGFFAIKDSQENPQMVDYWSKIKNYQPQKFSDFINNYKWLKEPVDYDIIAPNQFFLNKARDGRECNNFARIWEFYALENGYRPFRVMVWEVGNEKNNCHMTCVLQDKYQKYYLADYTWDSKQYSTLAMAIDEIRVKYRYKNKLEWSYSL